MPADPITVNWPKITVVTPSFNQGRFVERAILSVVSQNYPNLEYLVFDAGSADDSVAVIKKHQKQITHWVSEADKGQSDAINKGWKMATGDVLAWLNSDDFYYPGALHEVGRLFSTNPDLQMVTGAVALVDEGEKELRIKIPPRVSPEVLLPWHNIPAQVGTFISRDAFERVGGPRLDLHYVMDWELWLRVTLNYPPSAIGFTQKILAADRQWSGTKTGNAAGKDAAEMRKVLEELFASNKLPPNLRTLQRPALARAWWRQSKGELTQGLRRPALGSLGRAVALDPTAFPAAKIFRQLRRILLPRAPGKNPLAIPANGVNV